MKSTIIVLAFIAGLIFSSTYHYRDLVEGFDTNQCPNLLIKKGKEIFLLNRKLAKIPGVNPIRFENLEEYSEYLKWQKRMGIQCPVLFLEETYDVQNKSQYTVSNNPFSQKSQKLNIGGGAQDIIVGALLDANLTNNQTYNKGGFNAYDPDNQNIGRFTNLDKMFHSHNEFSENAMDTNWRYKMENDLSKKNNPPVKKRKNINDYK